MKRLIIILALFLGVPSFAFSTEKPNILLIFADDIGYEVLNSYGGLDFEAPHLNRMAKVGIRTDIADPNDPAAVAAKATLNAVFENITPNGPRTPIPFPPVVER